MELQGEDWGLFDAYVGPFAGLIGDRRTGVTFGEIVKGIIRAGSLVCQRIAVHSAVLSAAQDGAPRVIRFAKERSTKRSHMDAAHLTAVLRQRGVEQLAGAEVDELWLIGDGSDLRKRYAREMPALMPVRDLDGSLVPGYRTLSVLGVTPQRRGVLYQRLFSSHEVDFVSESCGVQHMLQTVSAALGRLKERMAASWILDREFDDIAAWRTIWEQDERVVCRIYHTERRVEYAEFSWLKPGVRPAVRRRHDTAAPP